MKLAVVGHVEWVEFAPVERVPRAGEIITAQETWSEPAGGGADAAVQLTRLAGACTLFTALADDDRGREAQARLSELGVRVEAAWRPARQRRGFTFLDADGERTITVSGEKLKPRADEPLPWEELERCDGVFFVAGDAQAARRARAAPVLAGTARELPTLIDSGVALDALVGSSRDAAEAYREGELDPAPRMIVRTAGADGGTYAIDGERARRYPPAPVPGPIADSYGCGDAFGAGLIFALARGDGVEDALTLAARCGATCLTGDGPYGRLLTAAEL